MRFKEFSKKLDIAFHREVAAEWDNSGMMISMENIQVRKILIALDITDSVTDEAIYHKVDLIVSHHPLIFSPLKIINDSHMPGKSIIRLIKNKITVYAAHTNLDAIPGGINDILAEKVGLVDLKIIEPVKAHPYDEPAHDIYGTENVLSDCGIGRIGCLDPPLTVDKFLKRIKDTLGLKNLRWSGGDKLPSGKMIKNVAIINGSAGSIIPLILPPAFLCDMVIAGELKYHDVLELTADDMFVVELGHGESEMLAIDAIHDILLENFKGIEIIKSKYSCNIWRYYIE